MQVRIDSHRGVWGHMRKPKGCCSKSPFGKGGFRGIYKSFKSPLAPLFKTGLYPHMTQGGNSWKPERKKLSGLFGKPYFPEGKGYLAGGF